MGAHFKSENSILQDFSSFSYGDGVLVHYTRHNIDENFIWLDADFTAFVACDSSLETPETL